MLMVGGGGASWNIRVFDKEWVRRIHMCICTSLHSRVMSNNITIREQYLYIY